MTTKTKNKTKTRTALALAALAVGALTLAGCAGTADAATGASSGGSEPTVVVRVPDPGNSGVLAVGKKDGSLDKALAAVGARVEWTGTAGAFAPAAQALDNDELDIAQGSITSAIAALAQKPGFTLFAAVAPDKTGEGILVRDDSGIKTVSDLVGKKVVVWHGSTSEYLLLKALQNAGVPEGKVQRVYLPPNQSAAVLHSGQVDAWATWSTFSIVERAESKEHFLVDGGDVGSQNYSVWTARNAFAKQHPAVVKAFYDYLHTGSLDEIKNPAAYVNVFRTTGPDAVSGKTKELTLENLREGGPTTAITDADRAAFASVASFYADEKITPTTVDVDTSVIDVTKLQDH